ncbi:MAG: SAM-dependent methyltransferase [Phycisphaerales bacterium]
MHVAQRRILHDEYFKKAKAEGYVARSAYKLLEIQERCKVIRPGDRVLDLGCAPGSWLQVVDKIACSTARSGRTGAAVGIDLSETTAPLGQRVVTLRGDAFTTPVAEYADALASITGAKEPLDASAGLFHVILSDMAPSTSGHGDDLLSARLCRRVLDVAMDAIVPNGNLVMKILEGAEYPEVLRESKAMFRDAKGFKPKSSRDVSREMFIIGLGFKAARNLTHKPHPGARLPEPHADGGGGS